MAVAPVRAAPPAGGPVREFLTGLGLLACGIGRWARTPRLMLLGVLPALLAFALLATGFVVLCVYLDRLVGLLTPFTHGWSAGWRLTVQAAIGVALIAVALLLGLLLYTALALAIGDPCYEAISRRVDESLGGTPGEVDTPWWRSLRRSAADGLRLVSSSALVGLVLFGAGFLPVVGQTAVPVLGALVGGWHLTLEVTGVPFERRGLRLADRRRVLRARRPLALGFGTGTFLLFLIPLGAVLATPAVVAGATLLTRHALGEPDRPDQARRSS